MRSNQILQNIEKEFIGAVRLIGAHNSEGIQYIKGIKVLETDSMKLIGVP